MHVPIAGKTAVSSNDLTAVNECMLMFKVLFTATAA